MAGIPPQSRAKGIFWFLSLVFYLFLPVVFYVFMIRSLTWYFHQF